MKRIQDENGLPREDESDDPIDDRDEEDEEVDDPDDTEEDDTEDDQLEPMSLGEGIKLKVEEGDVRSIFTQEAGSFTFNADQINFDGHVFGQDATFEGRIEGAVIAGSEIYQSGDDRSITIDDEGLIIEGNTSSIELKTNDDDPRSVSGSEVATMFFEATEESSFMEIYQDESASVIRSGSSLSLNSEGPVDVSGSSVYLSGDVNVVGEATFRNTTYLSTLSTTGGRYLQLENASLDGVNGVRIARGGSGDGAELFLAHSRAFMSDEDGAQIILGAGEWVRSATIFNNDTTWENNQVQISSSGTLRRSTSSRRYKLLEEPLPLDYAEKILEVEPKSWFDRKAAENLSDELSVGAEVEPDKVERIPGMIAEDVHDAGLEMFVTYDEQGRPEGIHPKLPALLIPIIKDMKARLEAMEG